MSQPNQTRSTLSTAAAAMPFIAGLAALANPTAPPPSASDAQPRPVARSITALPFGDSKRRSSTAGYSVQTDSASFIYVNPVVESVRATTDREKAIGEIRKWSLLGTNWDGEGGLAPVATSLKAAESFACVWPEGHESFETMLFPSGHAGLLWDTPKLYADLKFLENGQVAYFIKRNEDRHKGTVAFNGKEMPSVFAALLLA